MTFVRYVTIQILAYSIDMGSFLLVINAGWTGPLAANALGKVAAGACAFLAHRSFTFRVGAKPGWNRQAVRYFSLLAMNVPLSSAVLSLVLLGVPHPAPAKLLADVICILVTYWLSRTYVFVGNSAPLQARVESEDM